jgi:hypothetical protein
LNDFQERLRLAIKKWYESLKGPQPNQAAFEIAAAEILQDLRLHHCGYWSQQHGSHSGHGIGMNGDPESPSNRATAKAYFKEHEGCVPVYRMLP